MDLSRGQKLLVVIGLATLLGGILVLSLSRLARENREAVYVPPPEPGAKLRLLAVHVAGAVRQPGVYWLPTGSRVSDAIALAGGVLPDADAGSINLAAPCEDGKQITVVANAAAPPPAPLAPAQVPSSPPASSAPALPAAAAPVQPAPAPAPPQPANNGAPVYPVPTIVSLNQATREQLEALPGIGPVLAGRILNYRFVHGGFRSIEELTKVEGIDARRLSAMRPHLRL